MSLAHPGSQDGLSLRKPSCQQPQLMAIAEFIIGRAFARPVGSTDPAAARCDEFPEIFQRDLPCPVPSAKRFRLTRRANQNYKPRRPVPEEGRWPSSRTLGRDAVDAAASGARWDRRAGFACERSKRADERCCYPGFEKATAEVHNPAKPLGENGSRTTKPCGPDTRCWCQVGGGFRQPNRVWQNL
jgi:hypothetical protein